MKNHFLSATLISASVLLASFSGTAQASSTTTVTTGVSNSTSQQYPENITPPASLPIGSVAETYASCMAKAVYGVKQISGNALLQGQGSSTYFNVSGSGLADVLAKLSDTGLKFKVKTTDPTKQVYVYGSVYDITYKELFTSFAQVTLEPDGSGGFRSVNTALQFSLSYQVPLNFPGAISAVIHYSEEYGNSWDEVLDVTNGTIRYMPRYSGKNATLVITTYSTKGGMEQFAYDLSTGKYNPGKSVAASIPASLANSVTATDKGMTAASTLSSSCIASAPWENGNLAPPPTATFTVTKATGTRTCTAIYTVAMKKEVLGAVSAYALDGMHPAADGSIDEVLASSVTLVTVGNSTTITVTWVLDNDAQEPDGTIWTCGVKIAAYENQYMPGPPYGGGQG